MSSDLQVDVNGLEIFSVSTEILASFSCLLRKMVGKSAAESKQRSFKVIFQGFPGDAEGFELIVRFCYNGGRIDLSPSNMFLLHSAAKYLDINLDQTMKYSESVHFWTWSELLDCLKHCQEFMPFTSSSRIFQEILNAVVENIFMARASSPFTFSCSDFSSALISGGISTKSSRLSSFLTINWLRDLEFLNIEFFDRVSKTMISQRLDHGMVCSFLLHYHKVRCIGILSADEKCRIIEVVITSLCSLKDGGFRLFPFRSLCDVLRASRTLRMGKCWLKKVERMIGSRLDEATLDDLLIPCHRRRAWAYDVNLILRFLKIFLGECRKNLIVRRLRRVGFLMDLYLSEVAPDPHLRAHKFIALALALPDSARQNHDSLCTLVLMYFKAHRSLNEEEKIRICSVLNAHKLSSESLTDIANNAEFPATAAMVILQLKFKTLSDEDIIEFKKSPLFAHEEERTVVHLSEGRT